MVTAVSQADKDLLLSTKKNVAEFRYTSCFCEENVYHLCKTLSEQGLALNDASDLFVVFISNPMQQVPFWRQKNSRQEDGFCVWDYHVICIQKVSKQNECRVWDLDSAVSFPIMLNKYVAEVLRPDASFDQKYRRLYRIIKAPLFLRFFASDRRHMKDELGQWLADPPPYNCITAEDGEVHNLSAYNTIREEGTFHNRDMALDRLQDDKFGIVLSQDGLLRLFACQRNLPVSVSDATSISDAT